MAASMVERSEQSVTIQVEVKLNGSMLECEEAIQVALNEAGTLATGEALKTFDTDGSPIVIGETTLTSKGQEPKTYQTPYGETVVERHVYQSSRGGKTYCPLERDARIVITSTPRFAKQISHKYAQMSSPRLIEDLAQNHGRAVSRSFVQDVADAVGSIAQAKEESWHYRTPKLDVPVKTLSFGVDGTCMLMCEEGYRVAMVGTISLYDAQGERRHTTYLAATPEYGKETFFSRMEREIQHAKDLYPQARTMGIADGASENWDFLEAHTEEQVLDFYHATGYLAKASKAACPRSLAQRQQWMDEHCHCLKHERGAAGKQLSEMEAIDQSKLSAAVREGLQQAITYFRNHQHQMNYAEHVAAKLPIGSGVTEAACKTIVKARLCGSGMKWKEQGAGIVLSLRTLTYTRGRWEQFWAKIDQYGFCLAT
jgi:hypothetical protein